MLDFGVSCFTLKYCLLIYSCMCVSFATHEKNNHLKKHIVCMTMHIFKVPFPVPWHIKSLPEEALVFTPLTLKTVKQ